MKKIDKEWEILSKFSASRSEDQIHKIIDLLLKNRGIKTEKQQKEFLNPKDPKKIVLKELGINDKAISRSIKRIKKALTKKEHIIIYGDYDADGICSTAILWETLYKFTKKVMPYIPDRFSEGYGINPSSIVKIKKDDPNVSLIITVDNGIVAFEAIKKAKELGIDVIITDHHQKDKEFPNAYSIVHTDKISGSGVSWFFSREIVKKINDPNNKIQNFNSLELAAIGTIADQLPLVGPNRSIAKFGLEKLAKTKRSGLKELFKESSLSNGITDIDSIGTYEVNYVIAPRLNAMGRLKHAMDSLRLLCTTDKNKASQLAEHVGVVNRQRQKIVEEVLEKAKKEAKKENKKSAIIVSGNYHEGVIGLAAGKLVEEFGRPAIVISVGKEKSKASARSIPGFNIIEEIKKAEYLLLGAGGHPMAAGLSIKTKNIEKFKQKFQKSSLKILTDELLRKTLKIDTEIKFNQINYRLISEIEKLNPFGFGNPGPLFLTKMVSVVDSKIIGSDGKHLKLVLEEGGKLISAIAFNMAYDYELNVKDKINVVYAVEENIWNGNSSLQLKIKDIKY